MYGVVRCRYQGYVMKKSHPPIFLCPHQKKLPPDFASSIYFANRVWILEKKITNYKTVFCQCQSDSSSIEVGFFVSCSWVFRQSKLIYIDIECEPCFVKIFFVARPISDFVTKELIKKFCHRGYFKNDFTSAQHRLKKFANAEIYFTIFLGDPPTRQNFHFASLVVTWTQHWNDAKALFREHLVVV